MTTLSVTIITKNEAANIRRCLDSVKWADEIIIVDSGSTDNTLEICREYTDKIYSTDWPGYGIQKNRALSYATKDWILSLDADEEVSTALKNKIQELLAQETQYNVISKGNKFAPEIIAYKIFRPVVFLNRVIKYATGASYDIRLFKNGYGRFTEAKVHETLLVNGTVGKLVAPIYHYSFGSVAVILNKMNKYTSLVAEQRYLQGKKGSICKAVSRALWMFIKVYWLQCGFLDGRAGFILAVSFAEGAYYRYVKLYCLNKGF